MFFKHRFSDVFLSWVVAMAMAFSLGACTRFLKEKNPEPQSLEMSDAKFLCLQHLPDQLHKFIRGQVMDQDIREGFRCTTEALLYFKNKTRGTYAEAYAPEDLRNFFGKYFLKENNVTPVFAMELFKLKKALFGGSDKIITKLEIQKVVDLLNQLKEQAVFMAPHMITLLGQNPDPTPEDLDQAIQQVSQSLLAILKQVDLVNSNYSFEDLKKLMEGLDDFINTADTFHLNEKLSSNMKVVEAAKNIVISENVALDRFRDWQVIFKTGTGLYREVLRYLYFLKGEDLDHPQRLQALLTMVSNAFQILEESLPMQTQGGIHFNLIDSLLDRLEEKKWLPAQLSSEALKQTYKKIILRGLDPYRHHDPRGLHTLTRTHVLVLKQELKSFQIHQNFIDQLKWDQKDRVRFKDLKRAALAYTPRSYIRDVLKTGDLEEESLLRTWKQGRDLLLKKHPVVFDSSGRLRVTPRLQREERSWNSLTKWNLMRALTRFLHLGYGQKEGFSDMPEEISPEGLKLWYEDFRQIGQELKAFDRRSQNAGARSFREANLFTFGGNGDGLMSVAETFDFVSFLIAGGMSSAEEIRQAMLLGGRGCGLKEKDIFDYPMLNEECFKAQLRQNFPLYFSNLPGLVKEVSALSENEWNEFYSNLMKGARGVTSEGGPVETSDLRTAVMILHYVESLMSVYDRDLSGKLNEGEIRDAAPRFYEFMKVSSPVDSPWLVKDFFLYLLIKGEKPTVLSYSYFQGEKIFGRFQEVGRGEILRVFKVLKEDSTLVNKN